MSRHRRRFVAVVVIAGVAGAASMDREMATLRGAVPDQVHVLSGVATSDGTEAGFAFLPSHVIVDGVPMRWRGPRLWVRSGFPVEARQRLNVAGDLAGGGFRTRFGPVAATISSAKVTVTGEPGLWMSAGAALRQRVKRVFVGGGAGPALVTGFLIGDTSAVSEADLESLRLSGLSHFVAVSGSNVALVVGGWWILIGLVLVDGRWRAATSLAVLVVFVIATRWEPSVVRASVMAAIVLGGRIIGRPIAAWSALGAAVATIVVAAPELVDSVGFQLSVAATAGVLSTAGMRRGWLGTTAAATVGAQLAVAPLLLAHFGVVPLLAPAANVLAAPLVTAATALGAVAAITGLAPLASLAGVLADAVTLVARAFAAGPQLGPAGLVGLAALLAVIRAARWRPLGIAALAAVLLLSAEGASHSRGPEAVFLDVGQGDAVLLRGGATILIDGGPNSSALRGALRTYGVRRIDLAILSHPHSDHITGLMAALDGFVVGRLWYPSYAEDDPALTELLSLAARRGVPAEAPPVGSTARVGPFELEVLGPQRRYASTNDGSLV
ncbi:MAG: ComEC/Rec2 family competence protein, partial [Acidimicrobiia bacterium]|nr:ComEC/Rec2 family competence protein [Acidimicrobiia bacterium]